MFYTYYCFGAYGITVEHSIRIAEIRVQFPVGPQLERSPKATGRQFDSGQVHKPISRTKHCRVPGLPRITATVSQGRRPCERKGIFGVQFPVGPQGIYILLKIIYNLCY